MRNPKKLPLLLIALTLFGLNLLGPLWQKSEILIVRNLSPSVPIGFYLVHKRNYVLPGEFAVFHLPKTILRQVAGRSWLPANPILIKPVIGLSGNHVCHLKSGIWINSTRLGSILKKDAKGAKLPELWGCYRLKRNSFFPFSSKISNSFDGRYFGAIKNKFLVGKASPLLTWN